MICSGGTGGHVIPSINFGNFLINKGFECHLIVDERGKKYSKKFKGKIYLINSSHFSGNIFFKINSIKNLLLGFVQSLFLVIKIKPQNCISFGSYATFMPVLSTLLLKFFFNINIFIHEQNSVIGKANLFFLPFCRFLFINFKSIKNLNNKYLNKTFYVGLPEELISKKKELIKEKNNEKKIIFVYGGSQGSIPLIEKLLLILDNTEKQSLNKIKLIIQAPKIISKKLSLLMNKLYIDYEINEFFENINEILYKSDVAFTRAGAGTIRDIIKYKIPTIIIPLPNSINNHQYYNAKYLYDKKGAILMEEKNFDIRINSDIFNKLLFNENYKDKIKTNLEKITLPEANQTMLNKIFYEKRKKY